MALTATVLFRPPIEYQLRKANQMQQNYRAENGSSSSKLTRINTIEDWQKYQLSQIIMSPCFDPWEQANARYMLVSGHYNDLDIIGAMLEPNYTGIKCGIENSHLGSFPPCEMSNWKSPST